jgi:hypothetical protein
MPLFVHPSGQQEYREAMFDELLSSLTVDQLKPRLALLETGERPNRKADIIDLLRRHLLSPQLRDYWGKLEPIDRHAVAEAIHNWGGRFDPIRFSNKYSDIPEVFRAGGSSGSRRSKKADSTLSLFFFGGRVPEELCANLKAFVPEPEPDILETTADEDIPDAYPPEGQAYPEDPAASPYRVRKAAMDTVVRHDLPALLHLVDSGQVGVSDKTGLATAASLRKIEAVLMGGDFYSAEDELGLKKWDPGSLRPIRPYAWPLLLQTGGLAKRNGRKLDLTRKGKTALRAPFAETVKEVYGRWRGKGMLDEFRRIQVVKGQAGKGRRMTAVGERRAVIEEALECCPVGEWMQVDELFRYMQAQGHDFEVAHDYWKLYVADSNYGSLGYSGYHGFEILQGRYILVYLFEYLATLGLIDVAYVLPYGMRGDYRGLWGTDDLSFFSRYDGLLYFRLNPLGAWCLDLCDEYRPVESSEAPLLTVSEDLQIRLVRVAEPGELLLLDRYAERTAEQTWMLTAESVLGAMEQGQDLGVFRDFLEHGADQPLGSEAADFFAEIQNRKAALRDGGSARLLHCSDAGLVRLLTSDPATRDHCLQAGAKLLVVPEKGEKDFREGLRKLGYVFPAG